MEYLTLDNFFKYLLIFFWCFFFAACMTAIRSKLSAYRGIKKSELEEGEYCVSCFSGMLVGVILSHYIVMISIIP